VQQAAGCHECGDPGVLGQAEAQQFGGEAPGPRGQVGREIRSVVLGADGQQGVQRRPPRVTAGAERRPGLPGPRRGRLRPAAEQRRFRPGLQRIRIDVALVLILGLGQGGGQLGVRLAEQAGRDQRAGPLDRQPGLPPGRDALVLGASAGERPQRGRQVPGDHVQTAEVDPDQCGADRDAVPGRDVQTPA
jgi:hypothetical protein